MSKFLSVIERLEALKSGKEIRKKYWSDDLSIALEGKYLRYAKNHRLIGDRVAEDLLDGDCHWEIKNLKITPKYLGTRVDYEDGSKGLIIGYTEERTLDNYEVILSTDKGKYNVYGTCVSDDQPDIIKIHGK